MVTQPTEGNNSLSLLRFAGASAEPHHCQATRRTIRTTRPEAPPYNTHFHHLLAPQPTKKIDQQSTAALHVITKWESMQKNKTTTCCISPVREREQNEKNNTCQHRNVTLVVGLEVGVRASKSNHGISTFESDELDALLQRTPQIGVLVH